jgi:hypothetical protein
MSDLFFARKRLKSLRSDMGDAVEMSHDGWLHDNVMAFLDDLAKDLAARFTDDPEEAYHFIIRCMGAMAEAEADEAYEPYGFKNPFAPPGATIVEPTTAWPWPVVSLPDKPTSGSIAGDFNPFSALKMFGYTVGQKGRNQGWTDSKRQKFLSDFMEMPLPPAVRTHFGDEYGAPTSTTRLRKVANVIASNASNFARRGTPAYDQAIADWEADLAFLKATYYEGKGLKFHPWPEV